MMGDLTEEESYLRWVAMLADDIGQAIRDGRSMQLVGAIKALVHETTCANNATVEGK